MAMKPDTKLQMIAVDDVGAFTAIAFDNPEKYLGKEFDIAGDELSSEQMAEEFSTVIGKKVTFNELPVDVVRSGSAEVADMFQWFMDKGYEADIAKLKEIYPSLTSFREWLKKNWKA
jgi:uncharacterized protein YbjT (DUF2867 family)